MQTKGTRCIAHVLAELHLQAGMAKKVSINSTFQESQAHHVAVVSLQTLIATSPDKNSVSNIPRIFLSASKVR